MKEKERERNKKRGRGREIERNKQTDGKRVTNRPNLRQRHRKTGGR